MKISNCSTKFLSRDNEVLNSYFKDIRKFEVPTTEEENELYKRYKNGDMKAREELIVRNQRLIVSFAKQYAKNDEEVPDYISEGNIGLMIALEKYNPEENNNTKFITYASWYIRRQMNAYLNDGINMINRSNNMKFMGKIGKVKEEFFNENGYYPTDEIVAELIEKKYGIKVNDLRDVIDVNVASINEGVDEDYTMESDAEFNDKTASVNDFEVEVEKEAMVSKVKKILSILPEDKAEIVEKYFGIGDSPKYSEGDLAEEYDMSEKDIKKLINLILDYLRQELTKVA